ncbi:Protein CBG21441 [Caenorhabditis briggsae]|uniref:Protein CBG21441 n=1 Tax=Caenorhabditis briggsae TaxID=6238 RepID=A8Y022_CAEBR|nr:Protein CBG21441 [Caenorhabditis briggsae]CAP38240.2 Protein CBG21441 [Caenorhabditis briggsae]
MAAVETSNDTVMDLARRWLDIEEKTPIATADCLMDRPCHLKHVCWKFSDSMNEIWVDGVLGVSFAANQTSETGETTTKVHYTVGAQNPEPAEKKTVYYSIELPELARWHLAWLTDSNVSIDSATIDMEFDQKYLVEKRKFKCKQVNITVTANYPTAHGWLLHMDRTVESLIYRGNGIMDANKFLQLPFRWNDLNYPIRSEFIIYVQIENTADVVKKLNVIGTKDRDSGVMEYLIAMTNPTTRMRVITRPSSVVCTIFAIDNSQAPPPLATPTIS